MRFTLLVRDCHGKVFQAGSSYPGHYCWWLVELCSGTVLIVDRYFWAGYTQELLNEAHALYGGMQE